MASLADTSPDACDVMPSEEVTANVLESEMMPPTAAMSDDS